MAKSALQPKINYLTVCDLAMVNQDGKLSLIGMFDRIFAGNMPISYARLFVVGLVTASPLSEIEAKLSIISPTGNEVVSNITNFVRTSAAGKANLINDISGLVFEEIGEHVVSITLNDKVVATTSLSVTLVKRLSSPTESKIIN